MAGGRWLIPLLDAQTIVWKELERRTADVMQYWLETSGPTPSVYPLADAVWRFGVLGPMALQRAWSDWAQVGLNALRHDADAG